MLGEGVIAETYVSFDITWKNPGEGKQPEWDQTKQSIELHEIDMYPDLLYTKASALATYYRYTSIDKILGLISEINDVIDSKISQNEAALALPAATTSQSLPAIASKALPAIGTLSSDPKVVPQVSTVGSLMGSGKTSDPLQKAMSVSNPSTDSKESPKNEPKTDKNVQTDKEKEGGQNKSSGSGGSYTVNVIADRLKLIDIQGKGAGYSEVTIRHKVSENIVRQIDGERNDNSRNIRAEISLSGVFGSTITMEFNDFTVEDGRNLLVEILPSIELRFTPGEEASVPRSEVEKDEAAYLFDIRNLVKGTRMEKEIIAADTAEKSKKGVNK